MIENFLTPAGRIVWGNPTKAQPRKDDNGNLVYKDGKLVEEWGFGLAIEKNAFIQNVLPNLQKVAASGFPNGTPGDFSWKFIDGDGVDKKGKKYSDREGYGGCFILAVKTQTFSPPIFKFENNNWRAMNPEEIKTGDYVAVSINIKLNLSNDPKKKSGLYINPNGIQFVGYGTEIRPSANPENMFGSQPNMALPAGASATPVVTNTTMPMPGMQPAAPAQQYAQPAAPAPQQQQYAMPAAPAMPAPAHDFVNNAVQQPQQQYAMPAAPAPQQQQYVQPQQQQYAMPGQQPMPGMVQR